MQAITIKRTFDNDGMSFKLAEMQPQSITFKHLVSNLFSHYMTDGHVKITLGHSQKNRLPTAAIIIDNTVSVIIQQTPCGRVGVINVLDHDVFVFNNQSLAYFWDAMAEWGI